MWRTTFLLWVGIALVLNGGCAPTSEKRDTDFELQKLQRERDDLLQRLSGEQAKSLALQKRIEAEEVEWSSARAETARLNQRVDELTRANQQYYELIQQRANRPVQRPAVPASPLPSGG
ncbi:MAG: hypothetical protein KAY37_10800 [Phycisphaerae bacterium]|nr:hypothetical protein [Phycisphaerae bacterium]